MSAFCQLWTQLEAGLREVWTILDSGAGAVTKKRTKSQWYGEIYQVISDNIAESAKLHRKLSQFAESFLREEVGRTVAEMAADPQNPARLFAYTTTAYARFKQWKRFAHSIASFLDQQANRGGNYVFTTVDDVFKRAFHQAVYENCKSHLITSVLEQVRGRRAGGSINLTPLRDAVEIFAVIGPACTNVAAARTECYERDFETHYLAALNSAYAVQAADELTREGGHATYVAWVEQCFELERSLGADLLESASNAKIIASLVMQLLTNQVNEIVPHPSSGFAALLEDWKVPQLRSMYNLFHRVPEGKAVTIMAEALKSRVVALAQAHVDAFCRAAPPTEQTAIGAQPPTFLNDKTLIEHLLEEETRFSALLYECMDRDPRLQTAKKEAFDTVLSQKFTRADMKGGTLEDLVFAGVLVTYCDATLRGDLRDITDPDQEQRRLDQLIILFTYIREKDVFSDLYRMKLAKRLLQTTPDEDLERSFLERLQMLMGKSYTHKLKGMLHDRSNAQDVNRLFQSELASGSQPLCDPTTALCGFDCQVLTASNWPSYKSDDIVVPAALGLCIDVFTRYYRRRFATRKLTWIHMLGSASLSFCLSKGLKEVSMTVLQAAIILAIDQAGAAAGGTLAKELHCEFGKLLKANLALLTTSKQFSLLLIQGKENPQPGTVVGEDDIFVMNESYQHKLRKLKLPIGTSTAPSIAPPTETEIEDRRKFQIDACIVRIMKSRRCLSFKEVTDLTIEQLTKYFVPNPKQIKKRIDELITRDYVKRSAEDPLQLEYVA